MTSARRWVYIVFLVALGSCATLDEDECRTVDWHGLGLADGRKGEPLARLDAHRKACAQYGIGAQEGPYLQGRDLGLRDYCQPDVAIRTGLAGQPYRGVCPGRLDALFRERHDVAWRVHQVRTQLDAANGEIDAKERRLRDRKLGDEERNRLREDVRDLDRRVQRLRDELRAAERDLDRIR